MNSRLAKLGLPGIGRVLLPATKARIVWNPQGYAAWDANEALYKAHKNKPCALAEWGLWGIDDPAFVEKMAAFVKSHRRVEFLAYFNSKPGAIWDLASKPRSRAAYRRLITPLGR